MYTDHKSITIKYQVGGSDCGLFAIATECSLCHDDDPEQQKYNQSKMREHLETCLSQHSLLPFPASDKRAPLKENIPGRQIERIKVFCTCRMPDSGREMVQCTTCKEWFHTDCVKVPKLVLCNDDAWHCKSCSQ